jgi:hypothetical protein
MGTMHKSIITFMLYPDLEMPAPFGVLLLAITYIVHGFWVLFIVIFRLSRPIS